MPGYREYWAEQWGTSTYRDYHEHVLAEGTTPNGVFGTKIHSGQFLDFLRRATGRPRLLIEERAAVVEEWFPNPSYIWLRRRGSVRQALAVAKAGPTPFWGDGGPAPRPMDAPPTHRPP